MGLLQKGLSNLKAGTTGKALKGFGMAAFGAVSYAAIPTIIEAVSMKKDETGAKILRWDMTGWKGVITGLATTVIGGLACGSPEFAIGGASAATVHISFARLNDWVFFPILGKHLFRFDPKALDSMGDDTATLPSGAREVMVGGKPITVLDRASVETNAVSGYENGLMPEASSMNGYGNSLLPPAPPNLNGYTAGLSPQAKTSLNGYTNGLTKQTATGVLSDDYKGSRTIQPNLSPSGNTTRFMNGRN